LVENVVWKRGLAEKSEYHYMGGGSKIAKKTSYVILTLPRPNWKTTNPPYQHFVVYCLLIWYLLIYLSRYIH